MSTTEKIVRRCYRAYADKDRAAIETLVAPDFRFTSPLDDSIHRETYFALLPNSERQKRRDVVRLLVDGPDAFVTHECETIEGKRFGNTELFQTRDGQAVSVEVYFGWDIPHDGKAQRSRTSPWPWRAPTERSTCSGT